jgi:hypothetical protein
LGHQKLSHGPPNILGPLKVKSFSAMPPLLGRRKYLGHWKLMTFPTTNTLTPAHSHASEPTHTRDLARHCRHALPLAAARARPRSPRSPDATGLLLPPQVTARAWPPLSARPRHRPPDPSASSRCRHPHPASALACSKP